MKRRAPFISTSLITTPIRWRPHLHCAGTLSAAGGRHRRHRRRRRVRRYAGWASRRGLLRTSPKDGICSRRRSGGFRYWRIRLRPDAIAKRDRGWSKGSAKILSLRLARLEGVTPRLARQRPRGVPPPPAICCKVEGSWQALPPARCSATALKYCQAQTTPNGCHLRLRQRQ